SVGDQRECHRPGLDHDRGDEERGTRRHAEHADHVYRPQEGAAARGSHRYRRVSRFGRQRYDDRPGVGSGCRDDHAGVRKPMYENFRRILVTTDFSESGDHAIGHAFRMAADHGAEVLLLHVLELVVAPNPLYAHYYPTDFYTPDIRERAEQDARQRLLERVPKT